MITLIQINPVVPSGCDLHMLSASPVEQKEHKDEEEKTHPNKSVSLSQKLLYPPISAFLLSPLVVQALPSFSDPNWHAPSSASYPRSWWLLWGGRSSRPWIYSSVLHHQYEHVHTQMCTFITNSNQIITLGSAFSQIFPPQLPGTLWRMPIMKMLTITTPPPGLMDLPKAPVSFSLVFMLVFIQFVTHNLFCGSLVKS